MSILVPNRSLHNDPRACSVCGIAGTEHLAPPTKYAVSNCAIANDSSQESCQMCAGECPGAHVYSPKGEEHLAKLRVRIPADRPVAIIDLETTGVPNALRDKMWKGYENFNPQVIDVAASILMPDDSVKSRVTTRVYAHEHFFTDWRAQKALEITGLTYQELAPPAAQVGEALRRWLKKNECSDLVAFNDQFERFFLNAEPYNFGEYTWHDLREAAQELLEPVGAIPANPKFLGLNMISAWVHGHSGGKYGAWKGLSHGAVEDVRVTLEVASYLRSIQQNGFGR